MNQILSVYLESNEEYLLQLGKKPNDNDIALIWESKANNQTSAISDYGRV